MNDRLNTLVKKASQDALNKINAGINKKMSSLTASKPASPKPASKPASPKPASPKPASKPASTPEAAVPPKQESTPEAAVPPKQESTPPNLPKTKSASTLEAVPPKQESTPPNLPKTKSEPVLKKITDVEKQALINKEKQKFEKKIKDMELNKLDNNLLEILFIFINKNVVKNGDKYYIEYEKTSRRKDIKPFGKIDLDINQTINTTKYTYSTAIGIRINMITNFLESKKKDYEKEIKKIDKILIILNEYINKIKEFMETELKIEKFESDESINKKLLKINKIDGFLKKFNELISSVPVNVATFFVSTLLKSIQSILIKKNGEKEIYNINAKENVKSKYQHKYIKYKLKYLQLKKEKELAGL